MPINPRLVIPERIDKNKVRTTPKTQHPIHRTPPRNDLHSAIRRGIDLLKMSNPPSKEVESTSALLYQAATQYYPARLIEQIRRKGVSDDDAGPGTSAVILRQEVDEEKAKRREVRTVEAEVKLASRLLKTTGAVPREVSLVGVTIALLLLLDALRRGVKG